MNLQAYSHRVELNHTVGDKPGGQYGHSSNLCAGSSVSRTDTVCACITECNQLRTCRARTSSPVLADLEGYRFHPTASANSSLPPNQGGLLHLLPTCFLKRNDRMLRPRMASLFLVTVVKEFIRRSHIYATATFV